MWSLRQKADGSFYLTFDRGRRFTYQLRGVWDFVGRADNEHTQKYVRANLQAGYYVLPDDEGSMRMLILE